LWHSEAEAKASHSMDIIQDYDPLNPTEDATEQQKREEEELAQLEEELRQAERELSSATNSGITQPRLKASDAAAMAAMTFADKAKEQEEVRNWLVQEDFNDSTKWLPIRADQMADESDYQRVILYDGMRCYFASEVELLNACLFISDIRDCLLEFKDKELKKELVLSLFGLLGLPSFFGDTNVRASHHPLTIERMEMVLEDVGDAFSLLEDVHFPPQCTEATEEFSSHLDEPIPGQAAALQQENYMRLRLALERQAIDRSLTLVTNIPPSSSKQAFLR